MAKEQLRFTGSGGQGVILGTIIIAEAAFLDGKKGRSISILRTGGQRRHVQG